MIPKSLKNIASLLRSLSKTCPAKLAGLIVLMSFAGFFRPDISAQNSFQTSSDKIIVSTENEADQISKIWNEDSYRRAESLYLQAAGEWQSLGNHQRYAVCLRKAAQLNVRLNEFETAWKLLSDSQTAEQKTRNISGESETLSGLTLIALWKKDKKTAGNLQNRSLALAEKSKNPATLGKAYFAASQFIYRHKNDLPLMIKMLESSLKYFREANDPKSEIQILTELAYSEVMNNDRLEGKKLRRRSGSAFTLRRNSERFGFGSDRARRRGSTDGQLAIRLSIIQRSGINLSRKSRFLRKGDPFCQIRILL